MTADPEPAAATGARLSLTLQLQGPAAGIARRATRDALASRGLDHLTEVAILLVSELVGNAIRHARVPGSALELGLAVARDVLRIEVVDPDPRGPTPRSPKGFDEGGFGLVLVEALADDWGVQKTATGKAVWVELHIEEPAEPDDEMPTDPDWTQHSSEADVSGDVPRPANTCNRGNSHLLRPNVARMLDYYLGGKNNFAADREAANKVLAVAPDIPLAARENRQFLTRAVQFLTEEARIQQFIDIGPDLPTRTSLHHIADRFNRAARVAYVDIDPTVVSHGRALLVHGNPGLTMIQGGIREPEKILADPQLQDLINLGQPVVLCMTMVLQFIAETEGPHEIVARLLDALAPGSYVVVSHITGDAKDAELVEQITRVYDQATAPLVARSRDQVRRFFGERALVPPGVVYTAQWYRHIAAEPVLGDGGTRWAYAGVGLK